MNEDRLPLRGRGKHTVAPMMDLSSSPTRAPTTRESSYEPSYFTASSPISCKQRSPSVDSLPALSAPSPASSHTWYPSSSPPASTPPDSPVRTAFGTQPEESSSYKDPASLSSNSRSPVFIRRAEDDHGLHLLLLALESESRITFVQNAPIVPATINARQHDAPPLSPHLFTSSVVEICNPPLEYVVAFFCSFFTPNSLRASHRRPCDGGGNIQPSSNSQGGEPSNEYVPSSPPILPELSQEGISETHRDPEIDIVKAILDTPECPMTSQEEMSSSFTLPISQSHEPREEGGNVFNPVNTKSAPESVPESSPTIVAAPPIATSPRSTPDEARESMEVVSVAEAVSIHITTGHDALDLTNRAVEFAAASLQSSRAPSPLHDFVDPPQALFEPGSQPEVQPNAVPDVQEQLPQSAFPSPPASEDQIAVDIDIPHEPPSPVQPLPKAKRGRKISDQTAATLLDARMRKRQRREARMEIINASSCAALVKPGSSSAVDSSIRKRRITKRVRKSVSTSIEVDEASTNAPVPAPLKAAQPRRRTSPSAPNPPTAELSQRSDGSRNDPCENIDMPSLLVDALVFGRLSFLSAPDLARNLLRGHPYLLERLDDQAAWIAIVRSVLETQPFFSRIPRHGLDPDGKKLEDTWYYEAAQGKSKSTLSNVYL